MEKALAFYDHYAQRKWRNARNRLLSNWKVLAWECTWFLKKENRS